MIPEELRSLPQWIAWKAVPKPDSKPTKVPFCALDPNRKASSTDAATWASYREALACLDSDGIGFVFTADDPFIGIDMDRCVSPSGKIHPAAYEIVRALGGYVEFSPSDTGLHIIVRGRLERGRHTLNTPWRDELALYASGRFFTMTGDGRGEIRDSQPAIDGILAQYFPDLAPNTTVPHPKPFCGDDRAILDRVLADPRMARLWAGETTDHGGDHSAADCALCAHLAFLTGNDVSRIDQLFRSSGLYREKWNEPRGDSTYGQQTIARALKR